MTKALPSTKDSLWPDHVAHSVTDLDLACTRLKKLGFTLAPRSKQLARNAAGELAETGMANHCIMLPEGGYLEISGALFDGSAAVATFRQQLARHTGVHLLAMGCPDPEYQAARLNEAGFAPASNMDYQRMVPTESGEELARFTLAISPRELMPEARLLMVRHETPELLWQDRWVHHDNGAVGLEDVVFVVPDPAESAARLGKFTGVSPAKSGAGYVLPLAKGRMVLLPVGDAAPAITDLAPLPTIAGYVLRVKDVSATEAYLAEHCGGEALTRGEGWVSVTGGDVIGCTIIFSGPAARLPW